jgi:nucleoside-diphosphate-sugar epimerase
MKVFVAGATGAIGKQLIPQLVSAGHDVVGMTRSEDKADLVRQLGAKPVVADALDADAVGEAIGGSEPEVVVHQLTAIPWSINPRKFDRDFALTNRLRTEGTDHLLAASKAAGTRRFVAQSFAGWPFARIGGPIKGEEDPLDADPPGVMRPVLDAIKYLEREVTRANGIEGIVLRYGGFYGPDTSISVSPLGAQVEAVKKRRFPVVGNGAGIMSLIHIADAASATVAAIERGAPGVYNVVDDEPARVAEVVPGLAAAVGAKPPWRVPRWVGRLAAGEAAAMMMTEGRGASNAKAKRELGWQPRYPSWREGFATGLG